MGKRRDDKAAVPSLFTSIERLASLLKRELMNWLWKKADINTSWRLPGVSVGLRKTWEGEVEFESWGRQKALQT